MALKPRPPGMFTGGEINHHLGVAMSEEFVTKTLEVEFHDKHGRSFLYTPEQYARICTSLVQHVTFKGMSAPGDKPKSETKTKVEPKSFDDDEEL